MSGQASCALAARRLSLFRHGISDSQGKARSASRCPSRIEHQAPSGAALYAQISNAVVQLLREYTGRGPTKARTTIRDNVVLVMLEQTLTKGEQSLANKGRAEKVLEIRHEFQEAMREESSASLS